MNLVGYSKINCIKMFIEMETVNQLINFQYNDLKKIYIGKKIEHHMNFNYSKVNVYKEPT
jgi:hypothetical protein